MNFLFSSGRMGLKLGIVLCCAAALYGAALSPDILGFYHDDGVYAVTAKALAEGKGYRIISLPGEPVQMTYPIFYPLVLSVVWRFFPDFPANIPALKAPSIVFTLLFLWVTYLYLVRRNYASKRMALAIILMTAVNPWTVWAATMAMSEALYSLVSVLALWTTELFISSTWGSSRKRYIYLTLAGMAIAASITTRSIGISVLSATFIYLFINKRRGEHDRRQQQTSTVSSTSFPPSSHPPLATPDSQLATNGSLVEQTLHIDSMVFAHGQASLSTSPIPPYGQASLSVSSVHHPQAASPNHQPVAQASLPVETRAPQPTRRPQQSPDRRSGRSSIIRKGFALGTQLELAVCFFLAPWLVWTVMQYIHQTHMESYPYRPVFYGNYIQFLLWQWQDHGIIFFLKTCLINTYRCFLGVIPNMVLPYVDIGRVISLNFIKDYLWFGGIAVLGSILSFSVISPQIKEFFKNKCSMVNIYILFVLVIALLWPIEPDRFLTPILPFVLLFFLKGFSSLTERLKGLCKVSSFRWRAGFSSFILLFIIVLNSGLALAQDSTNIIMAGKSVEWLEKKRLFQWIMKNANEGDILAGVASPALYLYTGRKAIPQIIGIDLNEVFKPALSNDIVIENFRNLLDYTYDKAVYLVKVAYPWPPIYEQMIDRLAIKYPDRISLVYVGKDMNYAIYKMR